jgi:hypothetical protein
MSAAPRGGSRLVAAFSFGGLLLVVKIDLAADDPGDEKEANTDGPNRAAESVQGVGELVGKAEGEEDNRRDQEFSGNAHLSNNFPFPSRFATRVLRKTTPILPSPDTASSSNRLMVSLIKSARPLRFAF